MTYYMSLINLEALRAMFIEIGHIFLLKRPLKDYKKWTTYHMTLNFEADLDIITQNSVNMSTGTN